MFHVSKRELTIGATLTQGVYGERVNNIDFIEDEYNCYLKEKLFEQVRQAKFPKMPSRMNCVFLFEKLEDAAFYNAYFKHYKGHIYEVEIQEGAPVIVEMNLLKCDGQSYEQIIENAETYWEQTLYKNTCTKEVLLQGKAIVKKAI